MADTPEFRGWLEREFPQGAAEFDAGQCAEDGGLGRRAFMKLMGASTALAGFGLAACRRPEQYILPYAQAPEWVIPGKPTYYASAMPRSRGAVPLVVTTYEGRPTQVAPNRALWCERPAVRDLPGHEQQHARDRGIGRHVEQAEQ